MKMTKQTYLDVISRQKGDIFSEKEIDEILIAVKNFCKVEITRDYLDNKIIVNVNVGDKNFVRTAIRIKIKGEKNEPIKKGNN